MWANHYAWRAGQIHRKLARDEVLQVRWNDGQFITFRYPVPNSYGVRGVLVAIYTRGIPQDWIEDDLVAFARSMGETTTPIPA